MTGRFTSTFFVAGVLCLFSGCVFGSGVSDEGVEHCAAVPASQYASLVSATTSNISESCFVRASDVSENLDRYLVVNVSNRSISLSPTSPSVRMSDRQLKLRNALKRQPLLIIDKPHKRYSLARLCWELIQGDFRNPKILIGGIPGSPYIRNLAEVSPEEFIVEVSNFGAVVIALGQNVADQLSALGLPALVVEGDVGLGTQLATAESYSINGYLPIFLVGDSSLNNEVYKAIDTEKRSVTVFSVAGGIEGVQKAINVSALNTVNRNSDSLVSSCAH